MLLSLRPMPYKALAQFSHDMAMCAGGSADLTRSLELCLKPLAGTKVGQAWSGSVGRLRAGDSLADSLSPAREYLPPFFLPVIRAGEQTGRLAEAFRFLQSHCELLSGPASAIRNLWLAPLVILLFGSVAKIGLSMAFGTAAESATVFAGELVGWLKMVLVVAVVMLTPIRYVFDSVRLSLPWIGELEREIAVHRFFRVMALIYSVGGHRVELMIRTAAKTVGNHSARIDLLKAATTIEEQATVADAFRRVGILTDEEKSAIEVGELSGVLESAFDQIADDAGAGLLAKISYIQPILTRLVMAAVAFSIISALLRLIV